MGEGRAPHFAKFRALVRYLRHGGAVGASSGFIEYVSARSHRVGAESPDDRPRMASGGEKLDAAPPRRPYAETPNAAASLLHRVVCCREPISRTPPRRSTGPCSRSGQGADRPDAPLVRNRRSADVAPIWGPSTWRNDRASPRHFHFVIRRMFRWAMRRSVGGPARFFGRMPRPARLVATLAPARRNEDWL